MIPVTADVGRSCRQASAPVLQASAGEVLLVGNVGAPDAVIGNQPTQCGKGAGMRPRYSHEDTGAGIGRGVYLTRGRFSFSIFENSEPSLR